MKESCCQFGEHRALAGIVTEPATRSRRVGCVLINAGLIPKAGPYRLYVELARRLARDGFVTLRFDLGGVGDSRQDHTSLPLQVRTANEIEAAIDELTTVHGVDGVVLGGLCSGAEDAFRHAERDPRVRGVVMVDPFSYPTAGSTWRWLLHRATRRALRFARLYDPILPHGVATKGQARLVSYKHMERVESTRLLHTMIKRDVRVHFVYTGGQQASFNHTGQLAQMFAGLAFDGLVTVDYLPHLDHTQLLEEDRRTVVESIGRWLRDADGQRARPVTAR